MASSGDPNEAGDRGATRTDPFSKLEDVGRASLIPARDTVPETREEIVQRRVLRVVAAVVVLVLGATAAWVTRRTLRAQRIEAAVEAFERHATLETYAAVRSVLADATDAEERALLARVTAAAGLELDAGALGSVGALLTEVEAADPNGVVARAYLAIASWRADEAAKLASALVPTGALRAEAHRVRALAALAVGNVGLGAEEAAQAAAADPGSPRHGALHGWALARAGKWTEANAVFTTLGGGTSVARVAKAKAHALMRTWAEAEAAVGEEGAPIERAWARLVRGRAVLEREARSGVARQAFAETGGVGAVPGDEVFALMLAESLIKAGAATKARAEVLAKVAPEATRDRVWRSEVEFRAALELGDAATADSLEPGLPSSPVAELLRGEWLRARGKPQRARDVFAKWLDHPMVGQEARMELADLELMLGRPKPARDAILPALDAAPADPRVVSLAALALARNGDTPRALEILVKARAARPDDVTIVMTRARIELEARNWQEAMASAQAAVALAPADPDAHAAAGDAARGLGQFDAAKAHYEKALSLGDEHPVAQVGLLLLAVEQGDVEGARAAMAKVEQSRVEIPDADRARAFYWVLVSAGYDAARKLERITDASQTAARRDAMLWFARGMLHYQAEEHGPAARAFGKSAALDGAYVDPVLYRLFPQVELRLRQPAKHSVEMAEALEGTVTLSRQQKAVVRAARARYEFSLEHVAMAQKRAEQALDLDPNQAEAHLVLADLLALRSRNATAALKKAATAPRTPPRAWARLAGVLGDTPEACDLWKRYKESAPKGLLNPPLRRALPSCR